MDKNTSISLIKAEACKASNEANFSDLARKLLEKALAKRGLSLEVKDKVESKQKEAKLKTVF